MTGEGEGGGPGDLSLNPDVVEDDELLGAVVDEFIVRDPDAGEIQAEVARLQGVLHDVIDGFYWPIFARADELTTARWADLAVEIARWAFAEGRRFPAEPEDQEESTGP